jgi:4'-phosphopantetheinyl transferase
VSPVPLDDGITSVTAFSLAIAPARLAACRGLLSAEELERAARFRFERDRRRFVAGRAMLRTLAGAALGVEPASLQLAAGPAGKPALRGDGGAALRINLSRSGEVGVVALQTADEVGVDVEAVRPFPAALAIARRQFAPGEYRAVRRLAPQVRDAAFFRLWTRKEAVVKAIGRGLSQPLAAFALALDAGAVPELVRLPGAGGSVWLLPLPDPCPGYVAAVATVGPPRAVRFRWADTAPVAAPSVTPLQDHRHPEFRPQVDERPQLDAVPRREP